MASRLTSRRLGRGAGHSSGDGERPIGHRRSVPGEVVDDTQAHSRRDHGGAGHTLAVHAEQLLDRFFDIWKKHISIETHYVFGNHDLVGTKNPAVSRDDPRFGKGLFQKHLDLPRLYYSFENAGWRFIILDDVWPNPDGTYYAEYKADQLAFLQSELQKESSKPTIIACHIPAVSVFPAIAGLTKLDRTNIEIPSSLVSRNTKNLIDTIHGASANVKLVLAGHLHHQERVDTDGICYLNGGAVCGNWWKGANMGCPEGFNIIDLHPDGTFSLEYRAFGWKAA